MAILTSAEAEAHLRVDLGDGEEYDYVKGLIAAAEDYIERETGVVVSPREETFSFPKFDYQLDLPKRPVRSIVSVEYVDTSSVAASIADGGWRTYVMHGVTRLGASLGTCWPSGREVMVKANVGYENAADIPMTLKQAAKLLIGHFYTNREAVVLGNLMGEVPIAVDALLSSHRTVTL